MSGPTQDALYPLRFALAIAVVILAACAVTPSIDAPMAPSGDLVADVPVTDGGSEPQTLHLAREGWMTSEAVVGPPLDECITSACIGGHVSVALEGPEAVSTNQFCEWKANASGGSPGYTYEWYIDHELQSGETGSRILIPVGTESFTLAVIVWDSLNDGTDEEIQVDVDSQNPVCIV